jgi:hypothetical protein
MTHGLSAGWSPFQIAGSLQAANNRETCTGCHVDRPAWVRTPLAAVRAGVSLDPNQYSAYEGAVST